MPLLRLEAVSRDFDVSRPWLNRVLEREPRRLLRAVDRVDLEVERGETLALVGESGCGKSTVARLIVGLYAPTEGRIAFGGRRMQMIFQDPYASLNPRWRVKDIVAEPIRVLKVDLPVEKRVADLLVQVGLSADDAERYPHEFSGGQRQRIAVARALVLKPRLVVLDEPTSALDVSVQAQVVELLRELQARHRLAYLFISHDLRVVRALAHRIVVLKDGKVVEEGETEQVVAAPRQPYTRALMAAAFDLRAAETNAVRA